MADYTLSSETRLIVTPIKHTDSGAQLDETIALVYRTSSLNLSTEARPSAAQLTGEIPDCGEMLLEPGSMVILEATDNKGIFKRVFVGFLFTYSINRFGVVSFTAFDAVRYLQNPATGRWMGKNGMDISEIVRDIVRQCGLRGMAEQMDAEVVGVKPVKLLKIAESGLGIIDEILEWAQLKATADENGIKTKGGKTYMATQPAERWVFVDNCGQFVLCTANQLANKVLGVTEPPVIGTGAAVFDLSVDVSIDESANTVWCLRASEGGYSGWEARDPDMVEKWGPLTYYEKIDNAYCRNNEQMQLRAAIELCTRDCEKRTINIDTIGITGLRAGMYVRINIPWLEGYIGDISKSKLVYLDSVVHEWKQGEHKMTLKADVLPGDIDLSSWKAMVDKISSGKKVSNKNVNKETEGVTQPVSLGKLLSNWLDS